MKYMTLYVMSLSILLFNMKDPVDLISIMKSKHPTRDKTENQHKPSSTEISIRVCFSLFKKSYAKAVREWASVFLVQS